MTRELEHDVNTGMYLVSGSKSVPEGRCAGCQQEEPAPTAGLRDKPAAKWGNGSWEMSQRDLMAGSGSKAPY